jgi:hypothetical protein
MSLKLEKNVNKIISLSLLSLILTFILPSYLWSQSEMPKENYKKDFLFDLKVDKSPVSDVFVGAEENYYVLHSKNSMIEIFDKTGSFVRKIEWNNPYPNFIYHIRVDEDGNILLCGAVAKGVKDIILDKTGTIIDSFKFPENIKFLFSRGVIYQVTDGKVLYALPAAKSSPGKKMFFKDFDETYDKEKIADERKKHIYLPNHNLHLPQKIGDFQDYGIYAITNDNTSFAFYETKPDWHKPGYTFQNPYQIRELVKFNSDYQIEGVIPTPGWPFVNLETDNLYENKVEEGIVKIYRWDKLN